jgi:hypothetical protein
MAFCARPAAVFAQSGVPRTVTEKIDDAAQVQDGSIWVAVTGWRLTSAAACLGHVCGDHGPQPA